MNRSMTVSIAPTVEPVSLAEMHLHLLIVDDDTSQDSLISALIKAAREKVEHETGRALVTQTQVLRLDAFPSGENEAILLSNPPLQSVSAIEYVDGDGNPQTLAPSDYLVDTASTPPRVTPAYGESWPATRAQLNAVSITCIVGYAPGAGSPTDLAANVPESLKAAIKLLVAAWFENREAVGPLQIKPVPMAYESLIWNHRVLTV